MWMWFLPVPVSHLPFIFLLLSTAFLCLAQLNNLYLSISAQRPPSHNSASSEWQLGSASASLSSWADYPSSWLVVTPYWCHLTDPTTVSFADAILVYILLYSLFDPSGSTKGDTEWKGWEARKTCQMVPKRNIYFESRCPKIGAQRGSLKSQMISLKDGNPTAARKQRRWKSPTDLSIDKSAFVLTRSTHRPYWPYQATRFWQGNVLFHLHLWPKPALLKPEVCTGTPKSYWFNRLQTFNSMSQTNTQLYKVFFYRTDQTRLWHRIKGKQKNE